jgi:hypothetical protein
VLLVTKQSANKMVTLQEIEGVSELEKFLETLREETSSLANEFSPLGDLLHEKKVTVSRLIVPPSPILEAGTTESLEADENSPLLSSQEEAGEVHAEAIPAAKLVSNYERVAMPQVAIEGLDFLNDLTGTLSSLTFGNIKGLVDFVESDLEAAVKMFNTVENVQSKFGIRDPTGCLACSTSCVYAMIFPFIRGSLETIQQQWVGFRSDFAKLVTQFKENLPTQLEEALVQAKEFFTKTIINAGIDLFKELKDLVMIIPNFIGNQITQFIQAAKEKLFGDHGLKHDKEMLESKKTHCHDIKGSIEQFKQLVLEHIQHLNNIVIIVLGLFDKFNTLIAQVTNKTVDAFRDTLDQLIEFILNSEDRLDKVFEIRNPVSCIIATPTVVNDIHDKIKDVEIKFDLKGFRDQMNMVIDHFTERVTQRFTPDALNNYEELLGKCQDRLTSFMNMINSFEETVDKVINGIGNTLLDYDFELDFTGAEEKVKETLLDEKEEYGDEAKKQLDEEFSKDPMNKLLNFDQDVNDTLFGQDDDDYGTLAREINKQDEEKKDEEESGLIGAVTGAFESFFHLRGDTEDTEDNEGINDGTSD